MRKNVIGELSITLHAITTCFHNFLCDSYQIDSIMHFMRTIDPKYIFELHKNGPPG